MRKVQVIRVGEREMGEKNLVPFDDENRKDLAAIWAEGITEPHKIAKKMGNGTTTIQVMRSLRDGKTLHDIKEAVKARAILYMPKALNCAIEDLDGEARNRPAAREFIKKVAIPDEPSFVNQNNQVTSWDPKEDEELWARGRAFFEEHGKRIAAETVEAVLRTEDD